VGGGTASATATIGNNIPCARRSAAVAFFTRMDVVVRWQRGGCGDNGSGNVLVLAVRRAGVGQRNESRRGEEETQQSINGCSQQWNIRSTKQDDIDGASKVVPP
jgi:hypothetical protein